MRMRGRTALRSSLLLTLVSALVAAPISDAFARSRGHHHVERRIEGHRSEPIAAAIVIDMNTGRILYQQSPDTPRHPASLTKMMTLYVLFSYLRAGKIGFDSELVVTPHASAQAPTKLNLKPGDTIRTIDAIGGLVTQSANDAAVTVAENLGGTEENFARMMTRQAHAIGMTNTYFVNASGLPNPAQVTTARDMAILAQHLIHDYPEYYGFFDTKYFSYHGHQYRNHNHLLFGYRGTDGIKTGYTREAGFNLTASVHRDTKHLVAVVLGGRSSGVRDAAMRSLLDRSFPIASAVSTSRPVVVATAINPMVVTHAMRAASSEQPMTVGEDTNGTDDESAGGTQSASDDADAGPDSEEAEGAGAPSTVADPAPAPKARKPVFALAGAGPISFGTPAKRMRTQAAIPVRPVRTETIAPIRASLSPKEIVRPSTGRSARGPYHVQVGAYPSQKGALARLGDVKDLGIGMLRGHDAVAIGFDKGDGQWYRARFAGFSQDAAARACAELKRKSVDCIAVRAD